MEQHARRGRRSVQIYCLADVVQPHAVRRIGIGPLTKASLMVNLSDAPRPTPRAHTIAWSLSRIVPHSSLLACLISAVRRSVTTPPPTPKPMVSAAAAFRSKRQTSRAAPRVVDCWLLPEWAKHGSLSGEHGNWRGEPAGSGTNGCVSLDCLSRQPGGDRGAGPLREQGLVPK